MFIENELKQNERRIESKVSTFLHISRLNAKQTSIKALFFTHNQQIQKQNGTLGSFFSKIKLIAITNEGKKVGTVKHRIACSYIGKIFPNIT